MGNSMTRRLVLPLGRAGTVTPLLRFLAGAHSDAIAVAWPAPHMGFFVLPSARRHAAAVLLGRDGDGDAIVPTIEHARDGDVARLLMLGHAPGGLMKAFGRLGEKLWNAEDYDLLLSLFSDENTAQLLRHTDDIRAPHLQLINKLPVRLRVPRILANIPDSPGAAEDLAEAFRLAVRLQGEKSAAAIAERWERAGSALRLFDMAAEDLQPIQFDGQDPPPELPEAFVQVRDRKMLEAVALEFRNCLRDYMSDIAGGRMAVYVLRDGAERAVLALRQDPVGWRLADVKAKDNYDVRDETLRYIVEVVERAGGRTGESSWSLGARLHDHACQRCGPANVPVRETWRDQLMLGRLWD